MSNFDLDKVLLSYEENISPEFANDIRNMIVKEINSLWNVEEISNLEKESLEKIPFDVIEQAIKNVGKDIYSVLDDLEKSMDDISKNLTK